MAARILLLSGYDAVSHRSLFDGLTQRLRARGYDVGSLALPARHFAWRVRSNALSWCFESASELNDGWDLVIATSMVDVSALRSIVPAIRSTPFVTVFHENQFAYPLREGQRRDPNMMIRDLYVALASDRIVFNSEYNRRSFLEGATDFLRAMPDHAPLEAVAHVRDASQIIPVPITLPPRKPDAREAERPLHILWNHRWEWDKAPERFFRALQKIRARATPFRLSVVGQSFRQTPAVFEQARREFSTNIEVWGWVESRDAYIDVLRASDVVISTAIHEFQGLAILEACAHGCVPLAPDRLSYPELFPATYLYASAEGSEALEDEAESVARQLIRWNDEGLPPPPALSGFAWDTQESRWLALVEEALNIS